MSSNNTAPTFTGNADASSGIPDDASPINPASSTGNSADAPAAPISFTPSTFDFDSQPTQSPTSAVQSATAADNSATTASRGNDVIQPDLHLSPADSHYDQKRRNAKSLKKIVPAVIVIVALAALGGAYTVLHSRSEHASALASCNTSYDLYQKGITRLNDTIQNASTIASQITAAQVTDPATVDAMNKLISETQTPGDVQQCTDSQSTADIKANDQAITAGIESMGKARQDLSNATAAAQTSKYQKDLQDAQVQLTTTLQAAQDHAKDVDMTTQAGQDLNKAVSDATRVLQSGGNLATLQSSIQSLNDAIAKAPAVRSSK